MRTKVLTTNKKQFRELGLDMSDFIPAIVRVWRGNPRKEGQFLGTAFFIDPEYLLTAAHVVDEAQGQSLFISGQAWQSGATQYKVTKTFQHPEHRSDKLPLGIDVALLHVAKPGCRAWFNLGNAKALVLQMPLQVYGFYNDSGDIRSLNDVYAGEPEAGRYTLNSVNAKGMSGAPVLCEQEGKIYVVGVSTGRSTAQDLIFFHPEHYFTEFLVRHLPADFIPPAPIPINTPPDWLLERLTECLAEMDWLVPSLRRELQKAGIALQEDLVASLVAAENLVKCLACLHRATKQSLTKLNVSDYMLVQAQDLLGYLLLLSVDSQSLEQLNKQCCFQEDSLFTFAVNDPLGVELLFSILAKRPANLKKGQRFLQARGEYALDTDDNEDELRQLESGFAAEAIGNTLLAAVGKLESLKNGSNQSFKNDKAGLEAIKDLLAYRRETGEDYYYALAKKDNLHNPLNDPKTRDYIQLHIPLRLVFYGTDHNALIPLELRLKAPVHDFLTLLESYQT